MGNIMVVTCCVLLLSQGFQFVSLVQNSVLLSFPLLCYFLFILNLLGLSLYDTSGYIMMTSSLRQQKCSTLSFITKR
jgi:ACR3 family arsenite efflux pump ArsB